MNSNTIIKRILIWSEMIALSLWGIFFTVVCYNFITPESWRFLSEKQLNDKFYKYYSCGKDVYVLKNNGRRN